MSEFKRGDIICQIGGKRTFVVVNVKKQEPVFVGWSSVSPLQYIVMEVNNEGWCRSFSYHNLFQEYTDQTYVKIGEWDFKREMEVEDV